MCFQGSYPNITGRIFWRLSRHFSWSLLIETCSFVPLSPSWLVCIHTEAFAHTWTGSGVCMCEDSRECFGDKNVAGVSAGRRRREGWKGWNFRLLWLCWRADQELTPRLGWEEPGDLEQLLQVCVLAGEEVCGLFTSGVELFNEWMKSQVFIGFVYLDFLSALFYISTSNFSGPIN